MGGGSRIAPANDAPPVFFHAGVRGSFHCHVSPRPSFGGLAAGCVLAGGFPRVLFPLLWCFPPRCAGAVPPCGLLTRLVALLSCVTSVSFRASACQARTGSSLAAAGAPQLHASPLQQRRRLAHRPAHNRRRLDCRSWAVLYVRVSPNQSTPRTMRTNWASSGCSTTRSKSSAARMVAKSTGLSLVLIFFSGRSHAFG